MYDLNKDINCIFPDYEEDQIKVTTGDPNEIEVFEKAFGGVVFCKNNENLPDPFDLMTATSTNKEENPDNLFNSNNNNQFNNQINSLDEKNEVKLDEKKK